MSQSVSNSESSSNVRPQAASRSCFVCGQPGHLKKDCPTWKQKLAARDTGGKDGASSSSAPRSSSAASAPTAAASAVAGPPAVAASAVAAAAAGRPPALLLVDIGANLCHASFRAQRDAVIDRALDAGVRTILVTGTSVRGSIESQRLAATRPGVLYSTAGVHPHDAKSCDGSTIRVLRELASKPEVCAIGECGLDFNRNFSPPAVQERWFEEQLVLAAELRKPLFLHERDAHESFVRILGRHRASLGPCVVHCFTGTEKEAKVYLAMDCHIGLTGCITHPTRGAGLRDLLTKGVVPLERLMIETDAPFMAPRNMGKNTQHNEPAYLPYVLKTVAECYRLPESVVAEKTTENAKTFFRLH